MAVTVKTPHARTCVGQPNPFLKWHITREAGTIILDFESEHRTLAPCLDLDAAAFRSWRYTMPNRILNQGLQDEIRHQPVERFRVNGHRNSETILKTCLLDV